MLFDVLLCAAFIALVVLIACRCRPCEAEPTEFGATFDALQAERDAVAKRRVRARDHEAAIKAADRMIQQAKFGPVRDGREV